MSQLPRYTHNILAGWLCAAIMMGCSDSLPTDPLNTDAATLLAKLELNHKAIVLSVHPPYDTVRLDAVARNLYGGALSHTTPLTFRRLNLLDNTVSIDSAGLIRARSVTSGTSVAVSLVLDGVERIDTARIMVRSELPVQRIARIEFFPTGGDSAWRWAGATGPSATVTPGNWVRLYDRQNQPIANNRATVTFSSSNPEVHPLSSTSSAYVSTYVAGRLGETWLRVQLYAYDTTLVDSILFRRIEPPVQFVVIDRVVPVNGPATIAFYPNPIEVRAGNTVIFLNRLGTGTVPAQGTAFPGNRILRTTDFGDYVLQWVDSTGITFDDPARALAGDSYGNLGTLVVASSEVLSSDGGAGNIPSFSWVRCLRINSTNMTACNNNANRIVDFGRRARKFNVPGTYRYTSTAFPDASGTIVVTAAP